MCKLSSAPTFRIIKGLTFQEKKVMPDIQNCFEVCILKIKLHGKPNINYYTLEINKLQ
jgi:hypothetical protein